MNTYMPCFDTAEEAVAGMEMCHLVAARMYFELGYIPSDRPPYPDVKTMEEWYNMICEEIRRRESSKELWPEIAALSLGALLPGV